MRPRLSIARLLSVIAACGVGFAALRSATGLWASIIFSTTLLGFALAGAYAVHRRGPRRTFWSAFVAFGTGYMILAFGPWCETAIRPRLLTTKILDVSYPWVTQPNQGNALRYSTDGRSTLAPEVDATVRVWGPDPARETRFESIGHSLFALMLAVFGGIASRYFYANRDERRREAAEKAAGVLLKVLEAGL